MKISTIISNYNYGHFIAGAIDSALAQSYPDHHVIVIDDGSTDTSRTVIEHYGSAITAVFQQNSGQAAAINAGIQLAKDSDIIMLLDADDRFHPEKAARVTAAFHTFPNAEWLFHPLHLQPHTSAASPPALPAAHPASYHDIRARARHGKLHSLPFPIPATSGIVLHQRLCAQLFPMPTASKCYISDNYIKFLALALAGGICLPQPLATQLLHDNNLFTQTAAPAAMRAAIDLHTAAAMLREFPQFPRLALNNAATGLLALATADTPPAAAITQWQHLRQQLSAMQKLYIHRKMLQYRVQNLCRCQR